MGYSEDIDKCLDMLNNDRLKKVYDNPAKTRLLSVKLKAKLQQKNTRKHILLVSLQDKYMALPKSTNYQKLSQLKIFCCD